MYPVSFSISYFTKSNFAGDGGTASDRIVVEYHFNYILYRLKHATWSFGWNWIAHNILLYYLLGSNSLPKDKVYWNPRSDLVELKMPPSSSRDLSGRWLRRQCWLDSAAEDPPLKLLLLCRTENWLSVSFYSRNMMANAIINSNGLSEKRNSRICLCFNI